MTALKLCCPLCGTWAVPVVAETWTPPEGSAWAAGPVELVAGRCQECRSLVLFGPTPAALAKVRDRLAAAKQAWHGDGI